VTQPGDAEEIAGQMAAQAIAAGDPTGWFEPLYAAAAAGQTAVPWDRGEPSRYLTQWTTNTGVTGTEIDSLTQTGLEPVKIEDLNDPQLPWPRRWRAEFRRPAA
jgi:hypothetical protein